MALALALGLPACAGEDELHTISGRVAVSDLDSEVLGVRALQAGHAVAWSELDESGRFAIELPTGQAYRLEVVTAAGAHAFVAQGTHEVRPIAFDVCGGGVFDVGHVHGFGMGERTDTDPGTGTGGGDSGDDGGTDPGVPDCGLPCDPMFEDCAEPPPPCEPGEPNCDERPLCDWATGEGCDEPPPCDPMNGEECPVPPPCDPTFGDCVQPCDPMSGQDCPPPPRCEPGDPNCCDVGPDGEYGEPDGMGGCAPPCDSMDPTGGCYCNGDDPASECYCNAEDPASWCYCNESDPASFCYCDAADPMSWCNVDPCRDGACCEPGDANCIPPEPCDGMNCEVPPDCSYDDPMCWPSPEPVPCGDGMAAPDDLCWDDGVVPQHDIPDLGCEA